MNLTNERLKQLIKEELMDVIKNYREQVADTMKKASEGDKLAAQELLSASGDGIPGFKFNVIDGTKIEKSSIAKAYNLSKGANDKNQQSKTSNGGFTKIAKQQASIIKQNSQDLKQNDFPTSGNVGQKHKELLAVFQSVGQIQGNCFQVLNTLFKIKKIPANKAVAFAKTLSQYGKVYNDYMDNSDKFFDRSINKIQDEKQKSKAAEELLNKQIVASKKMLKYYEKILEQMDSYDGD
jgi:hypothetical protein|tara:strand:- start:235 stop:945 length:711 start_codon:yes stop_codon:yes gene_type:complete